MINGKRQNGYGEEKREIPVGIDLDEVNRRTDKIVDIACESPATDFDSLLILQACYLGALIEIMQEGLNPGEIKIIRQAIEEVPEFYEIFCCED